MPFLHIINLSSATGVVPYILKNTCVVPWLKCQFLDSDVMGNYRPVSNLFYVSKVIEKCVYMQVILHLESNSLLDCYQSAYKANHSCETALVKIHNDIIAVLDLKLNVVLIDFDLSAAFDTIHHKSLHLESNSFDCYQSAYKANHSRETALVKIHNDIITVLDLKLNVVLIVFDLSAAFDTIHHKSLLHKLNITMPLMILCSYGLSYILLREGIMLSLVLLSLAL